MATSATSGTNSTPRWGRSGEPGSAFSGLSRNGRGRGRGGARSGRGGGSGRGGEGGGGGPSSKDSKPDDDHKSNPKTDTLQVPSSAASKPSGSSSHSASPSIPEKSITSSPSSKSAKPPSRRASRAIPSALTTQIQPTDVPAPPASAKPSHSNRRKRSQTGKSNSVIPPKINPPAPNDNLLRPNKPLLGPVPHTAPVKDAPPHLSQKPDIRNDIDALVERVRAVAMDHNRPSTPGSHIDWAGDDDDSLPDLDDWGVNPATFKAQKADVISPIIVDGLRPLPDLTSQSIPNSPLKQVQNIVTSQDHPAKTEQDKVNTDPSTQGASADSDSHSISKEPEKPVLPKVVEPVAKEKSASPVISNTSKTAPNNMISTSKKPIHPSLPSKPLVASSYVPPKLRPGATPMRNTPYPRSPINPTSSDKKPESKSDVNSTISKEAPHVESVPEKEVPATVDQLAANDEPVDKPATPKPPIVPEPEVCAPAEQPKSSSPEQANKAGKAEPVFEGLSASIHAPKAMSDSVSAPANISTYPDLPTPNTSLHGFTHTRAHTVGRPPSFSKSPQGEYIPRFSRSGHSTPRGGGSGGGGGFHDSYHNRTHSTPPAGAMANHLRTPPSSRPVITGDAISRLARTIGRTGASSSSSSKPPQSVPLAE